MPRVVLGVLVLVLAGIALWWSALGDDGPVTPAPIDRFKPSAADASRPPRLRAPPGAEAPAPTEGIALEGWTLHRGAPCIARVTLYAGHRTDEPAAATTSGADGFYRFGGLRPGPYVISARAAGGLRGSGRIELTSLGADLWVHLSGGTGRLRGRLVTEHDAAWPGEVAARWRDDRAGAWRDDDFVSTDAEGRFLLGGLPAGGIRLVARRGEAQRFESPAVRLPHEGEYVFRIPATDAEVRGTVVYATSGQPVEGARVAGQSGTPESDGQLAQTATGSDGSFRLASLGGVTELTVRAAGYAPARLDVDAEGPALRVALVGRARVRGRVLDGAGAPVAGALVHGLTRRRIGEPGDWRYVEHVVRSDADGGYDLPGLEPGRWFVAVRGGGFASRRFAHLRFFDGGLDVAPGADLVRDIHVDACATIEGRVLDHEGAPVAGAFVRAEVNGPSLAQELTPPFVRSDAEGRFRLTSVPPNTEVNVRAARPGTADVLSKALHPDPKEPPLEIVLQFPPPRRLVARVLRAGTEEEPVPGARLWCEWRAGPSWDRSATATTDASGRVEIGSLAGGAVDLHVRADGFVQLESTLEADATGLVERTFHLTPARAIAGRLVYEEDGTPVAGTMVRLEGPAGTRQVVTDPEGLFRFEDLPAGRYLVDADARGDTGLGWTSSGLLYVEAGTEDVVITVPGAVSKALRIRVLDPKGRIVPAFDVAANARRPIRTERGVIYLSLGHRISWLEIRDPRDGSGQPLSYAPIAIGPIRGTERDVEVRFRPGLAIRGRVQTSDGGGAAGIVVSAHPVVRAGIPPTEVHGRHARGATRADGHFEIVGLAEGPYRLEVGVPPRFAVPAQPVVEAGAGDVTLTLVPATTRTVTVVNEAGVPQSRIEVSSRREGGGHLAAPHTDRLGQARLTRLDPAGRYRLSLTATGDRNAFARTTIESWVPADDTLVLPSALSISGRAVIEHTSASWCGTVQLEARRVDDEFTVRANADLRSRFTLGRLRPGRYRIRAWAPVRGGMLHAVTHADAGADDLQLVLRPGTPLTIRLPGAPAGLLGTVIRLELADHAHFTLTSTVQKDGTATFLVDSSRTYHLYCLRANEGVVAWRMAIPGDAGAIEVPFEPMVELRGQAQWPPDAARPAVALHAGALNRHGRVAPDGTFVFRGLPRAKFRLEATCESPRGEHEASVVVDGGGSVTVDLR